MQPETEVSIANFWFPIFQFGMSFIPGIFRITRAIFRFLLFKRKRNQIKAENLTNRNEEKSSKLVKEKTFKFVMKIFTTSVEIVVLVITFVIFLCSMGVTLCVSGDVAFDTRFV